MRQWFSRLVDDRTLGDGQVECLSKHSEPILLLEPSPGLPAEHRGTVDEHDPLDGRIHGGGIKERLETVAQHVQWVTRGRRSATRRRKVALHLVEDSKEEGALVGGWV